MSNYDDYFTGEDKPFAENLNDALLLSNVFDMTVPIELPTMFRDKQWLNTNSARKAGVSIIQLDHFIEAFSIESYHDEQKNEVSIIVANDSDIYLDIIVYPNFNSYGNLKKVYWLWDTERTEDVIRVDILTEDKTVLMRDVPNNEILESVPYLRTLNKFIFRLTFDEPTALLKFGFEMENKNGDRYGAKVGISDVNGLSDEINQINEKINEVNENITNIDNTEWVSLYQSANNPFCEAYVYLRKYNGFLEIEGEFNRQGSGVHILKVEIPEDLRFTPKAKENHRYYAFPLICTKHFIGNFNGERLYFYYDTSVYGTEVSHYFYGLYPIY